MQARALLSSVLRFDATSFKSGPHAWGRSRAGLDVLEACSQRLLQEIRVEGIATGLDVYAEVRSVWDWTQYRVHRTPASDVSRFVTQLLTTQLCQRAGSASEPLQLSQPLDPPKFQDVSHPNHQVLCINNLELCAGQGRLKSLYSIHNKMGRKGVGLEQVYDARALRVVVEDRGGSISQACFDTAFGLGLNCASGRSSDPDLVEMYRWWTALPFYSRKPLCL